MRLGKITDRVIEASIEHPADRTRNTVGEQIETIGHRNVGCCGLGNCVMSE
jgi:hypothetical protein